MKHSKLRIKNILEIIILGARLRYYSLSSILKILLCGLLIKKPHDGILKEESKEQHIRYCI